MELARLFATVGFKVDTEGLKEFRKELLLVKADLKEAALSIGEFKNNVKGMVSELRSFQKLIDPRNLSKFSKEMQEHAKQFNTLQRALAWSTGHDAKNIEASISSIGRLNTAIQGRYKDVMEYSQAILHLSTSFEMLKQATSGISRFRQVPSSAISTGGAGWGGSRSGAGRSPGDNQYIGYWGRAEGWAKSPFAAFIRPMLPTGMGLFNAVAGGYAFKQLVQTGREMMALELKMKAVSDDSKQFADNMAFVKSISKEMGLDIQQVGESFANIFVAAKGKVGPRELQEMFRGFSKFYTAMKMSSEDQRLANLAIQQMFGKDKIQAQEARLQMGQRVTPFIRILTDVAKENIKGFTTLDDAMKKGQLNPAFLIEVAKRLGDLADKGGAYQSAIHMSMAEQRRFNNAMKEFSKSVMEGGLDKFLANFFQLATKLVVVLQKAAPAILGVVNGLMEMLNWLTENYKILLAFAPFFTGFFVSEMAFAITRLTVLAVKLYDVAKALVTVQRAAMGIKLAFSLILIYLEGLYDYFNGNENWVYALQLELEIAASYVEEFYHRVMIWFYDIKNGWSNLFSDTTTFQGVSRANAATFMSIPGSKLPSGMTPEQKKQFLDNVKQYQESQQAPSQFVPKGQVAPLGMNFNINFNEIPDSAIDAFKKGNMYEFGKGVGEMLNPGGIGMYS